MIQESFDNINQTERFALKIRLFAVMQVIHDYDAHVNIASLAASK